MSTLALGQEAPETHGSGFREVFESVGVHDVCGDCGHDAAQDGGQSVQVVHSACVRQVYALFEVRSDFQVSHCRKQSRQHPGQNRVRRGCNHVTSCSDCLFLSNFGAQNYENEKWGLNYHASSESGIQDDFDVQLAQNESAATAGDNGAGGNAEVGVDYGTGLGPVALEGGVETGPVHEEENGACEGGQVVVVGGHVFLGGVGLFRLEEVGTDEAEVGSEHVDDHSAPDIYSLDLINHEGFVQTPEEGLESSDYEHLGETDLAEEDSEGDQDGACAKVSVDQVGNLDF